ncbi:MAG: TonB-dependent receptor, partial [Saprospiraceae bacterium]|nr:TonB-dependent receptor [Saprospiraceae bacterium]
KLGQKAFLTINGQYSTTSDVPRYDRLTETSGGPDQVKFSEWYYGPQERVLGSLKFNMFKENVLFDKSTIIASFQKIDEDRFSRKFGRSSRTWNSEDLLVYGLTMDFSKDLDQAGNHTIGYGFDGNYNDVKSRVLQQSVVTGRLTPGRELTRYPSDGSTLQAMGTYFNYRISNTAKTLFLDAGLRYSWVSVTAKYKEQDETFINWDPSFFEGIQNDNQDLSWALGLTWNSKDHWQVRALTARAFRAPNVDDIFKNRIKNDKAVLPNMNLRPETAISSELTLAKTIAGNSPNNVKVSLTGFYTQLDDVIVRRDGLTPDGESQIIGDGGQAIFDVQQNFNADQATIYGASGNILLKTATGVKLFGGINFTKGETTFRISDDDSNILFDTLTPMSHIPPIYGKAGISLEKEKFRIEGVYRFNGSKPLNEYAVTEIQVDPKTGEVTSIDREGSSDNLLQSGTCIHEDGDGIEKTFCEGALAWSTLNLYSTVKLGKVFSVNFAVENILDTHYRPFSSGISGAGRNFIVTLRAKF